MAVSYTHLLQFEVIEYRLAHEYNAACRWEPISIYKACWIESDNAAQLADFKRRKHTNMAVDKHCLLYTSSCV